MAQKITVEVTKKELIAPDIYQVTFHLVTPPTISYVAGQNMMLMIAPGVNRTMSIASPPSSASDILMVHDVSPMGPGSQWTVGLKVGDKATIMAPTGGVLSLLQTEKRKVLVATGTGIAPFRAILQDALEHRSEEGRVHASSFVLYWGLRYEQDVYWKEEFDRMSLHQPAFNWHLILSKPPDTWQGLTGHVTEHMLALEKELRNSEFYLCGNKSMVEEVRAILIERHVPTEQIKTELFF